MTYEQLIALNAVVTEGTFRAAAERLNKSQSTISHAIKKLEIEIDVVLLSREAYRPKLTSEGEVFFRQATRALQQMRQLGSTAKSLNAKHEAEVFIAVTATYPIESLLHVVRDATIAFPATHIRLSTEIMGGSIERLLSNDADIIIATMDGVPVNEVEAIRFSDVMIIPVAHRDLEPAENREMKTISEMQSYTQIVVADSGRGALSQSRDLLPGGLRWTVSDFATKKAILLAGMGWGGLPEHLIQEELRSGELVALNVEGYAPRYSQLYKIRKRDRAVGVVAQSIWGELVAE